MAIPTLIGYGMTIAHPIGIRSRCNPIRLIISPLLFIGDVQDTLRGKTRGFMENMCAIAIRRRTSICLPVTLQSVR